MHVTIEDAGPCKKHLKFEIPKETIEDQFEKKTQEACNIVELPGFRKGKAPRKLVEKRFGTQIKDDVKQTVISESYEKALEENKIEPVGEPKFDPAYNDLYLEIGKPLNFDVTLEVLPSFEIREEDYKGINLEKVSTEVTEEDVEKTLKELSLEKAQVSVVKDGSVIDKDIVICDCTVEVEGKSVYEDNDIEIVISDKTQTIATIPVPDLYLKLSGKKTGETVNIMATLPDSFTVQEYGGKEAEVKLVVNEIKRLVPPEINEDFAKYLNYESLDELKADIKIQLEKSKKRWAENELRKQIMNTLLERIRFDLPQDFVQKHAEERVHKRQLEMIRRGVPLDKVQKQTEELKNASEESVVLELKASLLLNEIAKKEKIFVTENEVEQRITDIAYAYDTDKKRVRKQLENQGNLSYLRSEMREGKALDFLLKEAKIIDKEKT